MEAWSTIASAPNTGSKAMLGRQAGIPGEPWREWGSCKMCCWVDWLAPVSHPGWSSLEGEGWCKSLAGDSCCVAVAVAPACEGFFRCGLEGEVKSEGSSRPP